MGLVTRLPQTVFGEKSDDDFSDRLNYRYTVALLILFSIILTTKQYGSEVIKCWVPAHFTCKVNFNFLKKKYCKNFI
jgi:hypothetical protein